MQIANEVLQALALVEVVSGNMTKMPKLERGLYLKVDQVLQACGGRWNKKAKAHVFDCDPHSDHARERIESAIVLGEVTTDADLGFFATPRPLAYQLVELADVRPGHMVLEPSAGEGAIVEAILDREANCLSIERDERRRKKLIDRYAGHPTFALESGLGREGAHDFMEYAAFEPFDRVVMNPPFMKCGIGDHLDHVRHAFSMLVPSGMLVAVMPSGIRFRNDKRHREFREWIVGDGGAIQDLPAGSFKASGTDVNTCVIRMRKGL